MRRVHSRREIDHDGLFKLLLSQFPADFLQAFFPKIYQHLELQKPEFLQQELIVKPGYRKKRADLVIKASTKGENKEAVLIHIEIQVAKREGFAKRMFKYFASLILKEDLPVIPIAVFAADHVSQKEEPTCYSVTFPFGKVLNYHFFKVELKRLFWRDYLDSKNPVALALMSKMSYAKDERVPMTLEFLKRIAKIGLGFEKERIVASFFETYVNLTENEQRQLDEELAKLDDKEVEAVQQLMTSWERRGYERGMTEGLSEGMAQGLSQGLSQGERQGQIKLLLHQVKARFGSIPPELENKFRSMPSEKLLFLSTKLLHASTLEEFKQACLS